MTGILSNRHARQKATTLALEGAICDALADSPGTVYELAEALGVSVDRIERCVSMLTCAGLVEVAWQRKGWTGRPARILGLARTRRAA